MKERTEKFSIREDKFFQILSAYNEKCATSVPAG